MACLSYVCFQRLFDTETYSVSPDLNYILIAHKLDKVCTNV